MINATITGHITQPTLHYTQQGTPYLHITIASTERKKDQQGTWHDDSATTWITTTIWDNPEPLYEQLTKGQRLTITGNLCTEQYTTTTGENREKLTLRHPKIYNLPLTPTTTPQPTTPPF